MIAMLLSLCLTLASFPLSFSSSISDTGNMAGIDSIECSFPITLPHANTLNFPNFSRPPRASARHSPSPGDTEGEGEPLSPPAAGDDDADDDDDEEQQEEEDEEQQQPGLHGSPEDDEDNPRESNRQRFHTNAQRPPPSAPLDR